MATTPFQIHSIFPYPTHASKTRKPDPTRLKAVPHSSSPWWTPLFGWSSEPDYMTKPGPDAEPIGEENHPDHVGSSRVRVGSGRFTEEKAKELRRKTRDSFHDVMYHSAIASRLASDMSDS